MANAAVESVDPPKPTGASGIMHDDLGGDDEDEGDDEAGLMKVQDLANSMQRRESLSDWDADTL
jgi:hypothetical protein